MPDEQRTERRGVETRLSPDLNALGQRRTRRLVVVAVTVVAVSILLLTAMAGTSASRLQTDIAGTPCPDATPGTSAPAPDATPALLVLDLEALCGEVRGFGTPVVAEELMVSVEADELTAGPRELTVVVVDATGQQVTDATVTVRTRSLEMDHGVSVNETVQTEPGRYVAERVSLGMGGDWLAEIMVERPGAEPVTVYVILTLDDPTHGH